MPRAAAVADGLVGRSAELAAFDDLLAALDAGGAGAAVVVGEPGIGKTRLLSELGARAEARGFLVLAGAAAELEHDLPFSVFVDALDDHAGRLDPGRLDGMDEASRSELAHVLPALSGLDGGVAVLQDERYRTHRAVRELLELLAADAPLVVTLDDLHWADSGSIELLGALLRRPPAAPFLLAAAVRPRQVADRLAAALERAQRAGRLVRLEVEALSREEAGELLGRDADAAVGAALYAESGGNPFYLEQLVRSVGAAPSEARGDADVELAGVAVPRAVAAALAEELGRLSGGARTVLEAAAVAGDPFEPDLVAAAADVGEDAAAAGIDALLRSDLVRPTDDPRRFRFRHPLVRRAVYDASPGGWRLGAHRRCADALAGRGASAAARAQHVQRSARHGDLDAVALLREAGSLAAQRTPADAARWFEAALRVLRDDAPAEERADLLMARAAAQAASGGFVEARAALLECLELLPDEPSALRVQLTAACAAMEQLLGRHAEAHERLLGALAALPDQGSPQAASLMLTLSLDAFFRQRYADSREWGERALEVARALDDTPLVAAATAAAALACAFVEAIPAAEAYASEAAGLIDAMPDAELAGRLDGVTYLVGAEAYLDRFEAASSHGRRALRLARSTGQGAFLPMLIQALVTALAPRGRLAEAAELLDGAIEGARLAGNDQTLAWDLLNRAFVAAHAGDLELAQTSAEESVEVARRLEDSFVSTYAGLMRAIARMIAGDAAAAELFVAVAGEDAARVPGGWRAKYLELLTRSRVELGRPADAARSAAAARAVADSTGLPMAGVWADRAAAHVALAAGDAPRAARLALATAGVAEAAGAPLEAALSRLVAGPALAQAGEPEQAVAELERAAGALDACGAVRGRLEAERELGRLGRRPHRRTRAGAADGGGLGALTARELEVARLVVDRRTNPEIASLLFLSQKTVETHLRNIFRKVGVSSRAELARAVEREAAEP